MPESSNTPDSTPELPTDCDPVAIRLAAMNLLARREHSQRELVRKLGKRFADEQAVLEAVQRLAAENLQSDERFAESFARQRAGRGYGPQRLRQEMRERGLSDDEIAQAFESAQVDWFELARDVYNKKFGTDPVSTPGEEPDLKEKARRLRFMQYRGFSSEHYRHLIDK